MRSIKALAAVVAVALAVLAPPALGAPAAPDIRPEPQAATLPDGVLMPMLATDTGVYFLEESSVRRHDGLVEVKYFVALDPADKGVAMLVFTASLDCARHYDNGGVMSLYSPAAELIASSAREPGAILAHTPDEIVYGYYCGDAKGAPADTLRQSGYAEAAGWAHQYLERQRQGAAKP